MKTDGIMLTSSNPNHRGRVELGRLPKKAFAAHNLSSWRIVETILAERGSADFLVLAVAIRGHESGDLSHPYPQDFISYCLRYGWLRRIN